MDIFERASRKKLRFATAIGYLSVEDLWDLPLTGKGLNLDQIARDANSALKASTEESFVAPTKNPEAADHQLRLDLAKHVIGVKLEQEQSRKDRAAKALERERLTQILATKQAQQLEGLTVEEIEARLNALND